MNKKVIFREKSRVKLKKFTKVGKIKRDKYVVDKLEILIKEGNYKNILLYVPLASEVDSMQLIRRIRAKVNIYVPFMEGVSFKMVKFRLPLVLEKGCMIDFSNPYNPLLKLFLYSLESALHKSLYVKAMTYEQIFI
jgi:5-formyltetrahydrofolate cyclo-ligase